MRENNLRAKQGGFALVELLLTLAVIAILAGLMMPELARADVGDGYSLMSLKMTNNLSTNITVGYPTNASGSNILGGVVNIANVDNFDVDFQAFVVNTSNGACSFTFGLCGALVGSGTPQISTNTNAWSNNQIITNQNDFVTNNAMLFTVPIPASYSNWLHWHTNISAPSIYQNCSHVGLYYISNNLLSSIGSFMSNNPAGTNGGDMIKIGKKVKAIRYP